MRLQDKIMKEQPSLYIFGQERVVRTQPMEATQEVAA